MPCVGIRFCALADDTGTVNTEFAQFGLTKKVYTLKR